MSKAALLNQLKKCVRRGKFVLASGVESPVYLDLKAGLFDAMTIEMIGDVLYGETRGMGFKSVGGLGLGCVPIITALQLVFGPPITGFVVRGVDGKKHGMQRDFDGVICGDCLIVDDVATSGSALMRAIQAVEKEGFRVIGVIPLVCRREGAQVLLSSYNYKPLFTISEILS